MLVTRTSPSGRVVTLDVPCRPEQMALWRSGVCIQDAMPQVLPPLREFVKTGISPQEWEEMFGAEPESCEERCIECGLTREQLDLVPLLGCPECEATVCDSCMAGHGRGHAPP